MGNLRSLIDQASDYAEALYDPDDIMMPHFVAEAADGGITVMAMAVSGRDLDEMRRFMERRFAADGYRRWCFFGESWLVEYQAGPRGPDPVDHPERVDVIQFDAFDVPGNRRRRGHRQILKLQGLPPKLMPLVFNETPVFDVPSVAISVGR